MLVLISTVVVVVIIAIYEFLVWKFDYFEKREVPGPKPRALFGNVPNMISQKRNITYDYDEIYKKYKGHQAFTGIFICQRPQVLIIEPETVKDVLVRNFKNFNANEFGDMIDKESDPIFGRNPFMLTGNEWKEKRAEITPAFTISRNKAIYPLIEDVCNRLTKYINLQGDQTTINLRELAAKYTTDVVCNTIYAVDAESFTSDKAVIREMGRKMMSSSTWFNIYIMLVSVCPMIQKIYKMRFVPIEVEEFFTKLTKDALEYRKANHSNRVDFLEYLGQLKEKKNLTNIDTAAHSISFFVDGFETSSIFIGFVLYALSMNKDVQDKLRNEINETGDLTFDSVGDMQYLDQVCNETLRMWPPGTILLKRCTESVELNLTKDKSILIDKGMSVAIPIYSIQRDPEHYPDPDTFKPERFDVENGGIKHFKEKGVFLSFGDGPRICLGMKFAFVQSKAAIVAVVRKYHILPSDKVVTPLVMEPKEFLNYPVGGLWAKFSPIN